MFPSIAFNCWSSGLQESDIEKVRRNYQSEILDALRISPLGQSSCDSRSQLEFSARKYELKAFLKSQSYEDYETDCQNILIWARLCLRIQDYESLPHVQSRRIPSQKTRFNDYASGEVSSAVLLDQESLGEAEALLEFRSGRKSNRPSLTRNADVKEHRGRRPRSLSANSINSVTSQHEGTAKNDIADLSKELRSKIAPSPVKTVLTRGRSSQRKYAAVCKEAKENLRKLHYSPAKALSRPGFSKKYKETVSIRKKKPVAKPGTRPDASVVGDDQDFSNEQSVLSDGVASSPCNCRKSACLKMYCGCFAESVFCDQSRCRCHECHNTVSHRDKVMAARNRVISKMPHAFKPKAEKLLTCTCKKTKCLKMYCECLLAGRHCNSHCSCIGCCNHRESRELKAVMQALGKRELTKQQEKALTKTMSEKIQ